MARPLVEGFLNARGVLARFRHRGLELVGNDGTWHAAEERDRARVARDPVRELLRVRRFRVRVARRAEHRDEQLHPDDFAGECVDDVRLLARVVDERLVAGDVRLPHREALLAEPLAVPLAERRVAVPVRVLLEVLDVQELQRDARTAQLDVQVRQVRLGTTVALSTARAVHARLELLVVELLDRVPVEAENTSTRRGTRHAARADASRSRRRAMAASELQLLPKDLS